MIQVFCFVSATKTQLAHDFAFPCVSSGHETLGLQGSSAEKDRICLDGKHERSCLLKGFRPSNLKERISPLHEESRETKQKYQQDTFSAACPVSPTALSFQVHLARMESSESAACICSIESSSHPAAEQFPFAWRLLRSVRSWDWY